MLLTLNPSNSVAGQALRVGRPLAPPYIAFRG